MMDSSFGPGEPVTFEGTNIALFLRLRLIPSLIVVIEYRACMELTMNWADSYDSKNWARLATILAPTINVIRGFLPSMG